MKKELFVGVFVVCLALVVAHSMQAEEVGYSGKGKYIGSFEYYNAADGVAGLDNGAIDDQAFASLGANFKVPQKRRVVITDIVVSAGGTLGQGGDAPSGVRFSRIDSNQQKKNVAVFQTASATTTSHSYSTGITFNAGEKLRLESFGPPGGNNHVELRGIVLKVN